MMRGMTLATLLAAVGAALILLYCSPPAHGQETYNPIDAVNVAKQEGALPAWADPTDRWRFIPVYERAATVCIENRQGGERWAGTGPRSWKIYVKALLTGQVEVPKGPFRRIGYLEYAACWPSRPIGDPVYSFVQYTGERGSALKWVAMNDKAVLRPSVPTEACGMRLAIPTEHTDPKVAWHAMPAGGMTRCREQ
jgi:hypothetical protein